MYEVYERGDAWIQSAPIRRPQNKEEEREEKGTGYFSTSFRVSSSSPQHRRKTVREVWEKTSLSPYLSRISGFPSGVLPGGLTLLAAEGATSGFVEMPGSRLGGFTAARGSPCFSGTWWIPGSIWEGGTEGVPDSKSFWGGLPEAGSLPLTALTGGSPAAETAAAGRRLNRAMAISRDTFPGHLWEDSAWGPLPHLYGSHDILTPFSMK